MPATANCIYMMSLYKAGNENSWQISAPLPAYSWLARETGQIQNPSWQTKNLTIL